MAGVHVLLLCLHYRGRTAAYSEWYTGKQCRYLLSVITSASQLCVLYSIIVRCSYDTNPVLVQGSLSISSIVFTVTCC